jgi:hypothetical protein
VREPGHLTRAAEQLLAEHLDSVGALDLLLLVHEGRDRTWSAGELCEALRCPQPWAEGQLGQLVELELLVEIGDGRFQYHRGRRFGPAVDEIARVCRRDRAEVTRRIFARSPFTR